MQKTGLETGIFPFFLQENAQKMWRREFQNKNGANSKTTEYAANIQKADLEEALQARYLMCSVQFPAVALQL